MPTILTTNVSRLLVVVLLMVSICSPNVSAIESGGKNWNYLSDAQYHVQTDEGPERYFRYQTLNGQYRKERRLADGTVIGTEGWLDPLGYLRLKDYIADHEGFRILRSKMVYVGKDTPIQVALATAKKAPAQSGLSAKPWRPPNPLRNEIRNDYYTPTTIRPYVTYIRDPVAPTRGGPGRQEARNDYSTVPAALQNEVHQTANGFQYYLRRQYHEEERDNGQSVGSFGYVDPFGIRRVVYYRTDPQSGAFLHKKNNKYVGFAAPPYDLSPPRVRRTNS